MNQSPPISLERVITEADVPDAIAAIGAELLPRNRHRPEVDDFMGVEDPLEPETAKEVFVAMLNAYRAMVLEGASQAPSSD